MSSRAHRQVRALRRADAAYPPAVRPLLLAAAWAPELTRLREVLSRRKSPIPIVARAVGVGLVEAAAGATRALAETDAAALLFVGTAGRYPGSSARMALGSPAIVRRLRLLSSGAVIGRAYLPRLLPAVASTDPALRRALDPGGPRVVADVACPVAITTSGAAARRASAVTGCALENLEAFAVGRAAALAGVPFAAVLGVSNTVGPAAHAQWRTHGAAAAAAACEVVLSSLVAIARALREPTRR